MYKGYLDFLIDMMKTVSFLNMLHKMVLFVLYKAFIVHNLMISNVGFSRKLQGEWRFFCVSSLERVARVGCGSTPCSNKLQHILELGTVGNLCCH